MAIIYAAENAKVLPAAHELKGSYSMARQPYDGFTKLMGFLMIDKLKAEDDNTFTALGMTFEQVAPYLYRRRMNITFLHFTMDAGEVEKVSMMTSDLMPYSLSSETGHDSISFLCAVAVLCSSWFLC